MTPDVVPFKLCAFNSLAPKTASDPGSPENYLTAT